MGDLFLLIVGVQGSGKGTQAAHLTERYGIPHVSTGDLFRAMRTRSDPLAQRIQAEMAAGKLIDDATTNEVLKDRLERPDAAHGALLDGYPRNLVQAQFLTDYLASRGQKLNAVLQLELDLYTAFKRSFGRATSKDGRAYNYYNKSEGVSWLVEQDPDKEFPPRLIGTLDTTGEVLNRRPDDANAFGVIERIEKFLSETQPVLPYYQALGLVRSVDASLSIDEVRDRLVEIVEDVR
ncbi:MAG: nucleoside monophosphate kinase [Chloroflexi bacterium]|nr:adenylate kinase [Anaerolineae bacterium]MCC6567146.1 nucleoside monophosphate kinase [Chloroflexota bacterium]